MTEKKVWFEADMKPIKEKMCRLQRRLLLFRLQEAAVKAGSHDPDAVALRCLDHFESELGWEGDVETISPLRVSEAVREIRGQAPHLWPAPEGGEPRGSVSGAGPKAPAGAKSKEDFRSEAEEADFMVKHGVEAYNSLPGKSRFLGLYTKP